MLEEKGARGADLSLYALLDAAKEPSVVATLEREPEAHQCLYEGAQAEELRAYAPYLVELTADSPLLHALAEKAIGNSYCVFVTCPEPLAEVRRHFRHFLLAKTEDGKEVYFRFYDPRVLRAFLPSCSREELAEFFGPLRAMWVEGREAGTLSRFSIDGDGSLKEDRRGLSEWGSAAKAAS
jgi:hypothetical protein